MRRLLFLFAAAAVAGLLSAGSAAALTITAGDFRLETSDWEMFDGAGLPGSTPQATNNLWGILRVDTVSDSKGNVGWQSGNGGEFISGVFGGLHLRHVTSANGRDIAYFESDGAGGAGPAFFRLFTSSADQFIGASGRGFETGPNKAGAGVFGTFGGSITSGTPLLSATFNAAALLADDSGLPGADGTDVYRAAAISPTTVQSTGYLDVDPTVGIGSELNTNGQLAGADLKITATADTRDPTVAGNNGWNGISAGQVFGAKIPAIPEPATILLLGSGLVGVGIYTRRRAKKQT
ncbi:MAG TPA: PEP-CTERM sorting domain-containing protein [Dissulfurispiraceae bacterium]